MLHVNIIIVWTLSTKGIIFPRNYMISLPFYPVIYFVRTQHGGAVTISISVTKKTV